MNCVFCQQLCQQTDTDGRQWKCIRHPHSVWATLWYTSYNQLQLGDGWMWNYIAVYKLTAYTISGYYSATAPSWQLSKNGEVLIKLDYIPPQYNPDNIDEKLPTLLVFQ